MDFYIYKASSNILLRWRSYTGDPFYGRDRYFRWELVVFNYVINFQWFK